MSAPLPTSENCDRKGQRKCFAATLGQAAVNIGECVNALANNLCCKNDNFRRVTEHTPRKVPYVPEQRNQQELQLKGELKDLVLIVRNVQEAIRRLKEAGADDSVICTVMMLMGFGSVKAEELLATSTPEEIARVIRKLSKRPQN